MKIVNIIGGLGNQMFQYAFAMALKEKFPDEEVLIDTSHFKHVFIKKFRASNLHRGFEIDKLFPKACLPVATGRQLWRVTHFVPNYALSRLARKLMPVKPTELIQSGEDYYAYNPAVFERDGDCYYEGIWGAVQYRIPIRAKLQQIFAHPDPDEANADFIRQIENEGSVGMHIRRKDYLQNKALCGICDLDYYRRAIELLLADGRPHTFYIFSDSQAWCETNIKPLVGNNRIVMVTHNTGDQSCWDMFLMMHCQSLVIANSSFSWWGAFLNKRGGRVIAPKKWTNRMAESDVWLPEWERI